VKTVCPTHEVDYVSTITYLCRRTLWKLRIITYRALREFGDKHASVKSSIDAWYKIVKSPKIIWVKPQDVVDCFGVARVDILGNDRVCINVSGNDIRIILKIKYSNARAYVRWIGWHKDYARITDINNI
jgi:mRNA interferase HigB